MLTSDGEAASRARRLEAIPLRPVGAVTGRGASWAAVRSILSHREMLGLLVRRDLKARYKDSALGFLWSLIRPLIQLLIYFIVMGQFLGAAKNIPDFAVYIFAGLSAVGLFTEIVVGGTSSVLSNAGLVKKVYLPREVFPLSSVGSALFNFSIQLIVLLLATLMVGKPPLHWELVYAVPSVLVIVIYGTAFALLFSAVNVYLRDTQYLVEVITMLLFWASPIVYSWAMVKTLIASPILLEAYTNNPLTLAVLGFHRAFWVAGGDIESPGGLALRLGISVVVGLVLLILCHRVFVRLQGNFAQEL
ncbi:MAG: ABC transporter permease [Microbacterium ginsengisoli]|uniref:ABC transporter permease n=1 Tax=Microbacterium TaxID=33882 RepID=UPI0006FD36B4|nr:MULTISPECIES: ABC transporter permease [unclassified Microbacterium]MBN9198641.1 ABC transporter permease [Microbacterium ginsengisoli]KQS00184.1 sugar ABC transporter [Microbacterium sp. Leaf347]KQS02790.1 sugar ABC transporter [Microbacterium sp. Leaf351]ODU76962.1 MAG: sugar ABC transporter [Microbacterium sp. SCN 71-21]OJU77648.1 MAG: sugar ABC transporter [Microbacterium sp. 71-23]